MDTPPIQTGIILIELHTRITVHVAQLSLYMRQQLQKKAEILYPLPDPKPFEREHNDIKVFGAPEGSPYVVPAAQNPEYIEAVKAAKFKQDVWLDNAVLSHSLSAPDSDTIIEQYRTRLEKARKELPDELPEDDFAAIVKLFLASREDLWVIYQGIIQSLPLTTEEVNDSLAYFRFSVQRAIISRTHPKQKSPSPESAESHQK